MSWFKKGEEAIKKLEVVEDFNNFNKKQIPEFWLKPNEEADVIFVDDEGFWCERHIIKHNGKYIGLTCKAGIGVCPLCLHEDKRPTGLVYYTVISLRPFTKRDGTVVKYQKVLLAARRTLATQIRDYKREYGTLVNCRVTLKRYQSNDASCGIIKTIIKNSDGKPKRFNITSLGADFNIPYNYEVILAPPTDNDLKLLGFTTKIAGDLSGSLSNIFEDISSSELNNEVDIPIEENIEESIDDNSDDEEKEDDDENDLFKEDTALEQDFNIEDLIADDNEIPKKSKVTRKKK